MFTSLKFEMWKLISGLEELVFPAQCTACHVEITSPICHRKLKICLCSNCLSDIFPVYRWRCRHCGAGQPLVDPKCTKPVTTNSCSTLEQLVENQWIGDWVERCVYCQRGEYRFSRCLALGNYEAGLREMVLKVKSGGQDSLIDDMARIIASIMSSGFSDIAKPDLVVPVPVHWRRRWTRRSIVPELLAARSMQSLDIAIRVLWRERQMPGHLRL